MPARRRPPIRAARPTTTTARGAPPGRTASTLVVALSLAAPCIGAETEPALLLNPFGDPFVQATAGRPCPPPRGPAYSEAARRAEAHQRIERGTSCWLAGRCAEPNAYRYDAANAAAAVAALRAEPSLASSAVWVTAQRRFVFLEGCVADAAQAADAEAAVKVLPDVEQVIPALRRPGERVPYAVAAPASRPR
jgi:hypothetical protein